MNLANEYQLLYYMFYLEHEKGYKKMLWVFLNYPNSRKKEENYF